MASAPPDTKITPTTSLTYWASSPPTVSGMLGGYPQISRADLKGSANFLAKIQRLFPSPSSSSSSPSPTPPSSPLLKRGLDCGAGIGRVTAGFLRTVCSTVDLVEPVEKFALEAQSNTSKELVGPGRIGNVYVTCLQDWVPPPEQQYDLIWIQWCLGHLTDKEVVSFLMRCKNAVTVKMDGDGDGDGNGNGGGWIVVKENLSTDKEGRDVFDEQDSSVTRTDEKWRMLFGEAGVRVLKTDLQRGFPRELYPVRFYALRP